MKRWCTAILFKTFWKLDYQLYHFAAINSLLVAINITYLTTSENFKINFAGISVMLDSYIQSIEGEYDDDQNLEEGEEEELPIIADLLEDEEDLSLEVNSEFYEAESNYIVYRSFLSFPHTVAAILGVFTIALSSFRHYNLELNS